MKHGLLSADILYSRKMKSRNSYVRATRDTEKYKETDEAKQKTQRGSSPRSCHHFIVFQKVEAQHWGMAVVKRKGVTRSFPQPCGPVPQAGVAKSVRCCCRQEHQGGKREGDGTSSKSKRGSHNAHVRRQSPKPSNSPARTEGSSTGVTGVTSSQAPLLLNFGTEDVVGTCASKG